jgi:hypothetical protein
MYLLDGGSRFFRCDVSSNSAGLEGGGAFTFLTSLSLQEFRWSFFRYNSAARGGAYYLGTGNGMLIDSVMSGNTGASGAAVYASGRLTLTNVLFETGFASFAGGAVVSLGVVTSSGCTYANNQAVSKGGAVSVLESGSFIDTGSQFVGNVAGMGGALMGQDSGTLTLSFALLANNTAGDSGGAAMTFDDTVLTVSDSCVVGNVALNGSGGAFGCWSANCLLRATLVLDNHAFNTGGGIAVLMTAELHNMTVTRNSAYLGGGIFSDPDTMLSLTDVNVTHNTATGPVGGGLMWTTVTAPALIRSRFSDNSAPSGPDLVSGPMRLVFVAEPVRTGQCRGGGVVPGGLDVGNGCAVQFAVSLQDTYGQRTIDPRVTHSAATVSECGATQCALGAGSFPIQNGAAVFNLTFTGAVNSVVCVQFEANGGTYHSDAFDVRVGTCAPGTAAPLPGSCGSCTACPAGT